MAADTQYRDIVTPEDVDWLLSMLGTDGGKPQHISVFSSMGPSVEVPAMVTKITGGDDDRKRLTEWLSVPNMRLFAQLDVAVLYLSPADIVFGRTKLPTQLKQQETKVKQLEAVRQQYEEDEKTARIVAADLKAKMAEIQRGPAVNDIRDQLLSWPQVIDFKAGPCWDDMSRSVIPANTLVVSFLPVLYDGDDMPDIGLATGAQGGGHRWAATNPVRLILHEAGMLTAFTGKSATLHPHILTDRVCQGNLTRLLTVMLRENNVPGAADALRQYSVSHNERDWLDRSFAGKAWRWWAAHVVKGNEPWRLGGWDGKTVTVATDHTPIVNIEEFFGGPVKDIVHVGMAPNSRGYITPKMIVDFGTHTASQSPVKGYCRMCGRGLMGCNCCSTMCSESLGPDYLCTATPVDNFVPVPRAYKRADGLVLRYVGADEARDGYICEHRPPRGPAGTYCGVPAVWHNSTATIDAPAWLCEAHLSTDLKALVNERVKSLSELAASAGTARIIGNLRHAHEHLHQNGVYGTDTHSHNHEHPKVDAATAAINVHDRRHLAYRGAKTGTSTIRHRRYM